MACLFPMAMSAMDFEIKILKQFTSSVYIWVHVKNYKVGDNVDFLLRNKTKQLTTKYTSSNRDVYILYMNNLKGIPPSVEDELHAKSIVSRSLLMSVMKAYFLAFCETSEPTEFYYYNPVETLKENIKTQ